MREIISKRVPYRVYDDTGIAAGYFGKAHATDYTFTTGQTELQVKLSDSANERVVGVFDNVVDPGGLSVSVKAVPGDWIQVVTDGVDLSPGDLVTNDAFGRATKVLTNATPINYYVHGRVVYYNSSDTTYHSAIISYIDNDIVNS